MTGKQRRAREPRSAAEWAAFGIALAFLSVVVGAVGVMWAKDDGRPARLDAARIGAVRAEGGQFYVRVRVSNNGERTAEAVQVLAELTRGEEVVEDGEQSIDFLAGGESADLDFVFSEDPSSGELTLRTASYIRP